MTQEDKDKFFDEFIGIGNTAVNIKSQAAQLQSYMTVYPAFFERIWKAGYKQGEKDALLKKEIRISKSN